MLRLFALFFAALVLAACTNPNDLEEAPAYLGNFHLGHNVVVAPNLTKGPASREASKEEWIETMKAAVDERFGRFDGTKLYHLGISIEGYVLAIPGVPVVASPKSALILNVTVWDDAAQKKLNEKPEQITVLESFSGNTILGSGLTQSKEKQMHNLTRNASKIIQNWLVKANDKNGWFEDDGLPAAGKKRARSVAAAKAKAEAEKTDATEIEAPSEETAELSTGGTQETDEIPGEVILDDPDVAPPEGEDG